MAQMGKALRSMGAALPGSQFSRGVATLVTGTAIAQLIVALTAPILTRLYDPSAVGVFAVASSIVSILIAVTCLRYEFAIPQRVGLGPHTLKLTVEDQNSQKVATSTVNFTVK